jgi:hypothetical protein
VAEKCIALTFNSVVTAKVYSLSHLIKISFLAKDESSWRTIQQINIPRDNLVAYVTLTTDVAMLNDMHLRKIKVVADASESMRNNASLYSDDFYRSMVDKMKLNILITDFSVDVSRLLK